MAAHASRKDLVVLCSQVVTEFGKALKITLRCTHRQHQWWHIQRVSLTASACMRLAGLLLLFAASRVVPMRLVLQRVKSASVTVDGKMVSAIDRGVLALVGLHEADTSVDLRYCAKKLVAAKLWPNENGKLWRKSVKQMDYEVLCVSQFTLHGDIGNKKHCPDFKRSMKPAEARERYDEFKGFVADEYESRTERVKDGVFGAMMDVAFVNDGPVTLLVDSFQDGAPSEDSLR